MNSPKNGAKAAQNDPHSHQITPQDRIGIDSITGKVLKLKSP